MKSPLIKDFDISYGAPTGLAIRLKTLHGFKEIHLEESHLNMPDIQEVLNEASLLVRMVKSETQARSWKFGSMEYDMIKILLISLGVIFVLAILFFLFIIWCVNKGFENKYKGFEKKYETSFIPNEFGLRFNHIHYKSNKNGKYT